MKVKILVFPLAISAALYIIIFLAQPEFDRYLSEQSLLEKRQGELMVVEQKVQNSSSLEQDLNAHKDSESFAFKYLPLDSDDDRVVDSVNYLASQSGVAVSSINLEPVAVKEDEIFEEGIATSNAIFTDNTTDAADSAPVVPEKPKARSVLADIEFTGSYEGIRDAINKIAQSDYFQVFHNVSVKQASTAGSSGEATYDNNLTASLKVDFSYLPKVKNANQSNNEIFSQSSFNFDNIQNVRQMIASPVPTMELGASGKANPFLR